MILKDAREVLLKMRNCATCVLAQSGVDGLDGGHYRFFVHFDQKSLSQLGFPEEVNNLMNKRCSGEAFLRHLLLS